MPKVPIRPAAEVILEETLTAVLVRLNVVRKGERLTRRELLDRADKFAWRQVNLLDGIVEHGPRGDDIPF